MDTRGEPAHPVWAARAYQALVHTVRRDVSDKGLLGSLHMGLRLGKVLLQFRAHQGWLKVLRGPTTRKLLSTYPRMAYRYTLPYLSANFGWGQRIEMLKAHYTFLNRAHDARFFEQVLDQGLPLHQWSLGGHAFSVSLHGPCLVTRHREGELCLVFQMDGITLYKLAFSVIPAAASDLPFHLSQGSAHGQLYVGQVQGASGQFERMREATRLCHDVAPQDALMSALAGIASAWGINRVLGVQGHLNLSSDRISQSQASFDYETFWARYQAELTHSGHHAMCLPYPERPLQEIASKHRKRTLTKRQFKRELAEAISDTLARRMSTATH